MRTIDAIVAATAATLLILMLLGCKYLTPPLTSISGPKTEIQKNEQPIILPGAKQPSVTVTVHYPDGTRPDYELPIEESAE